MDYIPRQETIRMLAAAAYLPLVAFGLLMHRRYRDVRLIRFHAYQAIGLFGWLVLMLLLGSMLSTLLGGLPGLGELLNMVVGLLFVLTLLGTSGVAFYGAVMASQGNFTSVPLLTDWVWLQVNGSGRPEPAPARKKRVRRRRPEAEGWEAPAGELEEGPY